MFNIYDLHTSRNEHAYVESSYQWNAGTKHSKQLWCGMSITIIHWLLAGVGWRCFFRTGCRNPESWKKNWVDPEHW
jgi:hypothetical protein